MQPQRQAARRQQPWDYDPCLLPRVKALLRFQFCRPWTSMATASWLFSRNNRIKLSEEYVRTASVVQHFSLQTGQKEPEVQQHLQNLFLDIKGTLATGSIPKTDVRSSALYSLWKVFVLLHASDAQSPPMAALHSLHKSVLPLPCLLYA
jgi:hypothetical protein